MADEGDRDVDRRTMVGRLGLLGAAAGLVAVGDLAAAELAAPDAGTARATVLIDDHGADPTGASPSDAAWRRAYAAALDRVRSLPDGLHSGVSVVFGPGTYHFSVGTIAIRHPQIGLLGQGRGVTLLRISGRDGDGLLISNRPRDPIIGQAAAAVGGFTLEGWSAGDGVNGIHFGDRPLSRLDFEVLGFRGAGSRNLLLRNDLNTAPGSEGTVARISTAFGGASLVTFDGAPDHGSFDYSDWWFHVITGPITQDHAVCEFVNGAHANGALLTLRGNVAGAAGHTATVLRLGAGPHDDARLNLTELRVAVENDGDSGTRLNDLTIDVDASGGGGLDRCHGQFTVLDVSGTTVAGAFSGDYRANLTGLLDAPAFRTGNPQVFGNLTAWRVR